MIMLSVVVRKACPMCVGISLHPHTYLCPESDGTAPAGSRTPWPVPLRVLVQAPAPAPGGPLTVPAPAVTIIMHILLMSWVENYILKLVYFPFSFCI